MLGRGERALALHNAMLPCRQNGRVEIREAEPYSYCQFMMGKDHAHHGQARHPWLTGSAGWFYTAATQWIMGVRPTFQGLIIDPCIPQHWKGFTLTRQWRRATYKIRVHNPAGVCQGIAGMTLNDQSIKGPVPPQERGSVNTVEATMGKT